jgi:hypothetical protein
MMGKSLTIALLVAACTTEAQPPPAASQCTEPRPQMCTKIYSPVCGVTADGARKTHGNSCEACADQTVVRHRPGCLHLSL